MTISVAIAQNRQPTGRLWQWLFLSILLLVLYSGVLPSWGQDLWNDENYSHGLLIPFISLYFFREQWPLLLKAERKTFLPGIIVVCLGLALLLAGTVGSEFFTKRFSMVVVLYGMVLFLEGRIVARLLRLPIALLLFAIPLPYVLYNAVAFPLKFIATSVSVKLFAFMGMPVFREGNIISLAHTTMEVVDACSGIRSLMTLFTLAFLLGVFHHKKWWKQLSVLIMAAPVAVFANAVRVTATGILTQYDAAWGHGTLHDITGWLVFVLSFVLLAGFSILLRGRGDKI